MARSLRRGLAGSLGRFVRDRGGMGAVEFAIIAPFLLTLYLGGSQLLMALTVNRKVQHTASTVNDLVTQSQSLTSADLKGIFNVAKSILAPYNADPLRLKVTSVNIDADGKQTVDWSCSMDGKLAVPAPGTGYALPASFATLRSRHIVVSETSYTFEPVAGYSTGTIAMGGTSYLNPRNGDMVAFTPPVSC